MGALNLDFLTKSFGAIGTKRTWTVVILSVPVALAYVAAYGWLETRIGWPEAFNVQCTQRRCLLTYMLNSYKLLGSKDIFAYLFFVALNLSIIVVVGGIIVNVICERRSAVRGK